MGKVIGSKLVGRMGQSKDKSPDQSFQQTATFGGNKMKSPTPIFDRKEVQRKQDREQKAAKQKNPSFRQNEEVIKKKRQLNLSPASKEALHKR